MSRLGKQKAEQIAAILDNPTYGPDSGVYKLLVKALGGLSFSDLSNLKTIIGLKVNHERGWRLPHGEKRTSNRTTRDGPT